MQPLICDEIEAAGIQLFIKRDDLLHPLVSGNKWRKLKYNLLEMKRQEKGTLLTFGGAYSNHIYATAAAGKLFGFNTIGFIRGEAHTPLNSTLAYATAAGMELHYLNRETYRNKDESKFVENLKSRFQHCYLLPEGGSNEFAVQGCAELVPEINIPFDTICAACGTGATFAGIIEGLQPHQKAIGFSALHADGYFETEINRYLNLASPTAANYSIFYNYHLGGYARVTKELVYFMDWFKDTFDIQLDPVYTGKLMYGIFDLIKKRYFTPGSSVVAVHTGGLQGLEGMKEKMEKCRQ